MALFIVLGGTAMAVDGSLPGQNTVGSADIINGEVGTADLQAPEAWHAVAQGSTTADRCADPAVTATFCSDDDVYGVFDRWGNYGSGYATAAFYKDRTGIVRFKGLVANNQRATSAPLIRPLFRLPAGYRPGTRRVFTTVGSNYTGQEVAAGRVDVQADGMVVFVEDCDATACSANGAYVSLDGISFRPDG